MENPTCAVLRAGPSFVPSPVTPTISPSTLSFSTKIFLVMNEQGLENEERSQAFESRRVDGKWVPPWCPHQPWKYCTAWQSSGLSACYHLYTSSQQPQLSDNPRLPSECPQSRLALVLVPCLRHKKHVLRRLCSYNTMQWYAGSDSRIKWLSLWCSPPTSH
jgi:hypothetical protein